MSLLRDIGDAVFGAIRSERRYRLEHPCPTAREFKARAQFWEARGRKVFARIAWRRYELWAARCRAAGGDC